MKNRLEMMEILYALSITGAVAVPLNYMVERSSLAQLINRSDAKYMFVEMEQLSKFEKILEELNIISRQSTFITRCDHEKDYLNYENLKNGSVLDPEIEISSNDLLAILYTSGTTSDPKGAIITHGHHIYRMQGVIEEWEMLRGDVMLLFLPVPIYHAVGQILVFRPALSVDKVVITREFDPVATLNTIQEEKITHAFFVPTIYIVMLNISTLDQYDLSSLKLLISAGSPLSGVPKRKIIEKITPNLLEFFVSSETSGYIMLYPKEVELKANSIGQQVAQAEVRLVDKEVNVVGINTEGEFAIRGPALFEGYYKLPEETENSFLPDGWFQTSDMGKEYKVGFYYLLDRKKDMIISGGVNVYPKDIEEVHQQ